jgi:hypothetical protein
MQKNYRRLGDSCFLFVDIFQGEAPKPPQNWGAPPERQVLEPCVQKQEQLLPPTTDLLLKMAHDGSRHQTIPC